MKGKAPETEIKCQNLKGKIYWNELCPFHEITCFSFTWLWEKFRDRDFFLEQIWSCDRRYHILSFLLPEQVQVLICCDFRSSVFRHDGFFLLFCLSQCLLVYMFGCIVSMQSFWASFCRFIWCAWLALISPCVSDMSWLSVAEVCPSWSEESVVRPPWGCTYWFHSSKP